ncbi:hypothetical protein P9302_05220 [Brevibacillus agri]|uniref:hypothetical protein n=1 Tax=Brevibacillus agri TaxID=51101 RepID=UPI0024C0B93F|nr:hypothetical protein [Brevibacillus agri]MED4568885.1 hypothetical protein [Brevibacillus agri]WHX28452.1 hypothetical protein QNK09_15105 [Brevibacillus agri]
MFDDIISNGILWLLFIAWVLIVASPSYRIRWLYVLAIGLLIFSIFWDFSGLEAEIHRHGH